MTTITHHGASPDMEPHWEQLDLTPWRCPEPLIRLKLWLRGAQAGQSLLILLKDPGSRQDIPAWLLRQTPTTVVAEIDRLLEEHTDGEIADLLNNRSLLSGDGKPGVA